MKDENKLRMFGGILRTGYEIFKENTVNSENKSYFDVLESCGRGIRRYLETDHDFENIYQGSDVIRTLKEFSDSVRKAFE